MTGSTLSQLELEERDRSSKHSNTPIHVGEELSEEGWKRFVFFEKAKDILWITIAVVGFVVFLSITTIELIKQHGLAVLGSIGVGIVIVLLAGYKR